ncbi:HAD family hydrolase [Deinococcus sp.]|uniref:HAD family hydrolase n=1 Tax=Deinococcus sp. TaxID=47478 RepID=UPI003CC5E109
MKAVLFDLAGTLHDRAQSVQRYLRRHIGRFEVPAGYAERWTELDDLGYRPKREVFGQLVGEFTLKHDPEALLQDFLDHAWNDLAPMPHAHVVLREVWRRGVRVGIVTNGLTVKQRACIRGLTIEGLIDDVIVSEAVKLRKPDPASFHLALERLGVTPDEAWYVGDSPQNDVAGPQSAGLRAALFPGGHSLPPEIVPDARLEDLRGVLALV